MSIVDKYGWSEAKEMVMAVIEVEEDGYGGVNVKTLRKMRLGCFNGGIKEFDLK